MYKLLTSSADPTKVSLAVKGFLITMAPIVMVVLGITDADYSGVVEAVEKVVFYSTSLIGPLTALYGLVRKVQLGRWSHPDA